LTRLAARYYCKISITLKTQLLEAPVAVDQLVVQLSRRNLGLGAQVLGDGGDAWGWKWRLKVDDVGQKLYGVAHGSRPMTA
jgi:hypothetical protein